MFTRQHYETVARVLNRSREQKVADAESASTIASLNPADAEHYVFSLGVLEGIEFVARQFMSEFANTEANFNDRIFHNTVYGDES